MAFTKKQAFEALQSQDNAEIYHRDLVGEQPIPHFFCQEFGIEMRILWSKSQENHAIGVICPRCFNPDVYRSYFEQENEDSEGDFW